MMVFGKYTKGDKRSYRRRKSAEKQPEGSFTLAPVLKDRCAQLYAILILSSARVGLMISCQNADFQVPSLECMS